MNDAREFAGSAAVRVRGMCVESAQASAVALLFSRSLNLLANLASHARVVPFVIRKRHVHKNLRCYFSLFIVVLRHLCSRKQHASGTLGIVDQF